MDTVPSRDLQIPLPQMVERWAGWLTLLFVGELFTATAMSYYQAEIARAVVLAMFVPLIISSGGNSGSQASSVVICALAKNEVRLSDWGRVLRRELAAGLSLGLILGGVGWARIALYLWLPRHLDSAPRWPWPW